MFKQKGVTIIELMIAMVLGLIVTGAVVQVFANNKQVYLAQDARARLQENARFALHTISEKIRKSGFVGCSTRSKGLSINNVVAGGANHIYDFQIPVEGFEATSATAWTPPVDVSVTSSGIVVFPNTDVLTIRYVNGPNYRVLVHPTAASPITIDAGNQFATGDFAIASNCAFATAFQITSFNPPSGFIGHTTSGATPANSSTSLVKAFDNGEITKITTVSYFISDRDNPGIPSLYQVEFNNAPVEIVSGVDDLQVEYGVDTTSSDGAADVYQAADAVTNWQEVVSVRITLNVRTVEDNLKVDSSAANKYLEQSVSRTISLRNRVP